MESLEDEFNMVCLKGCHRIISIIIDKVDIHNNNDMALKSALDGDNLEVVKTLIQYDPNGFNYFDIFTHILKMCAISGKMSQYMIELLSLLSDTECIKLLDIALDINSSQRFHILDALIERGVDLFLYRHDKLRNIFCFDYFIRINIDIWLKCVSFVLTNCDLISSDIDECTISYYMSMYPYPFIKADHFNDYLHLLKKETLYHALNYVRCEEIINNISTQVDESEYEDLFEGIAPHSFVRVAKVFVKNIGLEKLVSILASLQRSHHLEMLAKEYKFDLSDYDIIPG